jgi:hypothetical protein
MSQVELNSVKSAQPPSVASPSGSAWDPAARLAFAGLRVASELSGLWQLIGTQAARLI